MVLGAVEADGKSTLTRNEFEAEDFGGVAVSRTSGKFSGGVLGHWDDRRHHHAAHIAAESRRTTDGVRIEIHQELSRSSSGCSGIGSGLGTGRDVSARWRSNPHFCPTD